MTRKKGKENGLHKTVYVLCFVQHGVRCCHLNNKNNRYLEWKYAFGLVEFSHHNLQNQSVPVNNMLVKTDKYLGTAHVYLRLVRFPYMIKNVKYVGVNLYSHY